MTILVFLSNMEESQLQHGMARTVFQLQLTLIPPIHASYISTTRKGEGRRKKGEPGERRENAYQKHGGGLQ